MQIKFNFDNFTFYAVSATLQPQLGSVSAAYAVVAGGCDWPLLRAAGLSNNDVIASRALRQFRQLHYVCYVPYVACVALDGNPALCCKHRPQTSLSICMDGQFRLRI